MSNIRDLLEYIKAVDRLHVAVGLNGRTQLNKDFERFRSMPGTVTVSEYLSKRVRPYLPAGTTVGIYDPAGRLVGMTALLENIRIPEATPITQRR
ncbi:hypothetical protein [Asticcacaulis taihuensis]|jgi:hypothetical protein|uniref:Uncharacterized protein n=1 Tax=Asticcacaulis taihuensis TaxID=260084 RepID=A0A1G4SBY6_9CAUL|nr:hypothetical protein [Asticcacaulis taihuensis]SCW66085.1 hypothetical protein SAMN02927928_2491 [Asticcacaulis taihuensis]